MTDAAKKQFQILAGQFDKREAFYHALEDYSLKHAGKVPEEYQADWDCWTKIERRRPWRSRPLVIAKLKKAARKMARNLK